MYCKYCGVEAANDNAHVCLSCGGFLNDEIPQVVYMQQPKLPLFYKASFVLGILSICLGPWGPIIGLVGLPMAFISKRKSSIIMCIIGIVMWVAIYGALIIASHHTFQNFDHDLHIEQMIESLQQQLDSRQDM